VHPSVYGSTQVSRDNSCSSHVEGIVFKVRKVHAFCNLKTTSLEEVFATCRGVSMGEKCVELSFRK
jgi:hypothetical protein